MKKIIVDTRLLFIVFAAIAILILGFSVHPGVSYGAEDEFDPGDPSGCTICEEREVIGHVCDNVPDDELIACNLDCSKPGAKCDITRCVKFGKNPICEDPEEPGVPPTCTPKTPPAGTCNQPGDQWDSENCECIKPPVEQPTIKVIKDGTGTGRVTGSGIDCGTTCSNSNTSGVWNLKATPDTGSEFTEWSKSQVPITDKGECLRMGGFWPWQWGVCQEWEYDPPRVVGYYCGTYAECTAHQGTITATFTSTGPENAAPSMTISGPSEGVVSTPLEFTFRGVDPDGDRVRYEIDWDRNGVADQYLPPRGEVCLLPGFCLPIAQYVNSGTSLSEDYTWSSVGGKRFQARTRDDKGNVSNWVTKAVMIGEGDGGAPEPEPVIEYNLTVQILPSSSMGSATGAGSHVAGTSVESTATANTGYAFTHWSPGCNAVSGPNCTVQMNGNRTIAANFEQTLKEVKLSSDPLWVPHGGNVKLVWTGGSDEATCALSAGGSTIASNLSTPDSRENIGPIESVTQYMLECTDGVNTVSDTHTVYVLPRYGEF